MLEGDEVIKIVLFLLTFSFFCSSFVSFSVGIHQRPGDLPVNVCKMKQLTNMRAATKEVKTGVIPPVEMSLDACVEYIAADEILEVTPSLFRMAKNPALADKKKGGKK